MALLFLRVALVLGPALGGLLEDAEGPAEQPHPNGVGGCLGRCAACYELLDSLPREPFAAAATHTDPSRASSADLKSWLEAPEVCDVRMLYPVSVDGEMWSLAALVGGSSQLSFPGAKAHVKLVVEQCRIMQELSAAAFAESQSTANLCRQSAGTCQREKSGKAIAGLLAQWRERRRSRGSGRGLWGSPPGVDEVRDFAGNETQLFAEAFAMRTEAALVRASSQGSGVGLVSLLDGVSAVQPLVGLAMDLGRLARLFVEHARTVWGIRNLLMEISGVYPNIRENMPVFRVHSDIYGRHWDVLERLVLSLVEQDGSGSPKPLRMAELGVACGPIGLHLLHRFPSLQYFGADPTIRDVVRTAYTPYSARSQLSATTGEDMHGQLAGEPLMDFVFVDGPHTYKNVNNDIKLWESRVRPGGIIAGHDFTCRHPPLLWAVIEHRLNSGGKYINIGMDGVWWWQVE